MAAFSTKMARLNSVMEGVKGNTFVKTLKLWRERGLEARLKLGITADELITYLATGSPVVRLVFQELLTIKALEKVNKETYSHHQNLIVGEVLPANAFYLQGVLRACLIDARVLIMLYDVGAVGLNLHKAYNRVIVASLPRSRAQESQLAGRASRITSKFPLSVIRRFTPNSHDQFRSSKQTEKASLQLAANAHEPCVQALVVKLLNEFQEEVVKCHKDKNNAPLLAAIRKDKTLHEANPAEDDEGDDEGQEFTGTEAELEMFLSECQPNDAMRHNLALLKYRPGREWTEEDLENDASMELGLRLLYNKINGMNMVHLTKSVHIQYKQFSQAMHDQMDKKSAANRLNKQKARKQAM
ncbi:hypothetical protein BDW69DRAFT_202403 [Aspergillus filifer]